MIATGFRVFACVRGIVAYVSAGGGAFVTLGGGGPCGLVIGVAILLAGYRAGGLGESMSSLGTAGRAMLPPHLEEWFPERFPA